MAEATTAFTVGRSRKAGAVYPHVVEILGPHDRPGGLSIEVGCGGNQYGARLQARHVGLDLPQQRYAGALPAVYGDGRWLPFRAACADLVFMVAVLYLVAQVDVVLDECHRVLKPGGTLVVFDYNRTTTSRLKGLGAGAQVWSPRALRRRVAMAGFEARSIWDYELDPGAGWKRTLLRFRTVRYLRHIAPGNEGWNIVLGTRADGR